MTEQALTYSDVISHHHCRCGPVGHRPLDSNTFNFLPRAALGGLFSRTLIAANVDPRSDRLSRHPLSATMENKIIDTLLELVSKPDDGADKASEQMLATSLISQLKSLKRASNQATRLTKDATTAARHEMDQSHLRLQNLLYEKRHLEREIEKCRQFAYVSCFNSLGLRSYRT